MSLLGVQELLLAVAHLPSKLYANEIDQYEASRELAATIRKVEDELAHNRTVLVGDLNMNPFETGVAGANGLHGVMTREIALRGSRSMKERDYPFFYNPMWSLFGDGNEGSAGSYYRSDSGQVAFFWHIFDQVLLRPALLPYFRNNELLILTHDGTETLLSRRGLPNIKNASDHLPILFKLHL